MATAGDARRVPPAREVPCLLVRKGLVLTPGESGPQPLRTDDGRAVEVFDAFDRLVTSNRRVYVVDLDGVERNEPQLDLWPELARDADLWIDAGVPVADQAIDILVSGARRAILSTARLRGFAELEKAWGLSQELAFEIEVHQGLVPGGAADWKGKPVLEVARRVRALGPTILVLSPRGEEVDWNLVAALAAEGPTWVAGSYPQGQLERVKSAGARGGIYHPAPSSLYPAPAAPG